MEVESLEKSTIAIVRRNNFHEYVSEPIVREKYPSRDFCLAKRMGKI